MDNKWGGYPPSQEDLDNETDGKGGLSNNDVRAMEKAREKKDQQDQLDRIERYLKTIAEKG